MTFAFPTPVLDAIRALLKFKNWTTISEIAKVAGKTQKQVLDVVNHNGHMVWRDRDNGRITRVDPQGVLREKLWEAGAFFSAGSADYGSTNTLEFKGHDELRKRLEVKRWGGGLGDSYQFTCVLDTPENREALVADGCVHASDVVIDDRLWERDVP